MLSLSNVDFNETKTITTLGSIFLFINNTIGPGMMILPALMQQAGWLPTASCIILLCTMSFFIGKMLTFAIRKIPHNEYDDLKIEYLDLIKYYMGFNRNGNLSPNNLMMRVSQFMYLLFLISLLTGSLIQTCQTVDVAIARIFGHSLGFVYYPFDRLGITETHCTDSISSFCDAYNGHYVLSTGTLIIYAVIIPFCLKDLQEAIWIQYIGSYGTMLLLLLWCFMLSFSKEFSVENVPIATRQIDSVLGFNFYNVAFICTYPSWLNEKKDHVSYKQVLRFVAVSTAVCFILVGYLGGIAFAPFYMTTGDLLTKLDHFEPNPRMTHAGLITFFQYFGPISSYLFPILQCLSGIPVFSTIIRYNLINTHILKSPWTANIFAILIPFMASIPLSHGDGFNLMLNWSGVVFSSFINFMLPIYFYYKSLIRPQSAWTQIARTPHHKSLLQRSHVSLERLLEIEVANGINIHSDQIKASKEQSPSSSKRQVFAAAVHEDDYLLLGSRGKACRVYYDESMDAEQSVSKQSARSSFSVMEKVENRSYRAKKALLFLICTVALAVIAFALDLMKFI